MPHVRSAIVVGVLCAVASSAAAQPARYRRNSPVKVEVELSERTRPKPRPAAPADGQPTITGEAILAAEAEVRDLREEQIELLRRLIDDTPDSEPIEKADLIFRLADSLAQLARFHRLEGVRLEIAGGKAAEAKQHARASLAARKQAEQAYERLVGNDRYRAYPGMSKALFSYGFALQQSTQKKERDKARQIYHRLLTEHPSSDYVPHAYLAFADYYFEVKQLPNAAAFYEKVLKFPKSNVHTYARFMLGWVHLNTGENEQAGKDFLDVIRATDGVAKQASLNAAAQRDFVRAFSEFGDVRKAWPMLGKIAGGSQLAMMERLAELYVEKGKSDRAVFAYRTLITEASTSVRVCAWQHDIAVEMLSTPGTPVATKVDEIVRLVDLHAALAARKTLPAAEARDCRADAAAMSGELARAFHNEASKTGDPELLAAADRLYRVYVKRFPDAGDWAETAKYHAELAWLRADKEPDPRKATQLWRDAAAAFTVVVHGKRVPQPIVKDAASGALDALRNALAVDPRPKITAVAITPAMAKAGSGGGKLPAPRPIPEAEQALLAAIDDYLTFVTDRKDPERVAISFLRANILRHHDHLEEALPVLQEIIEQHPETEQALWAADITLNVHVVAGQHDRVTAWGRWFAAHPGFMSARADQDRSALARRVDEITRIGARIEAQECETAARKTGDYASLVACGNRYLAIFNDAVARAPSAGAADKLDEVLYNAGVLFEDGRSLSAAIDVYTQLRERYPDSTSAARALARLGTVHARVAYYERASANFEEYARTYAGEDDAFKAMNDAVVYRKGMGQDEQALENTAYFVRTFGAEQPRAAADAFFSMGTILEKRGDLDAVAAHYRTYLKRYGEQGGSDRVVVAYARIGQILWDQACPVRAIDGSCVKITRERAVGSRATRRAELAGVRTQCGPPTKMKLTVVKRDPRKVAAAMTAFGHAIAEYERRSGTFAGGDARAARHAYATARFHKTEVTYETFLDVRFPDGLDFDPAHAAAKATSDKRLNDWFVKKDGLASRAGAEYLTLVREVRDPAMAIASAARVGQLAQTFSDALYTAEVPAFLRPYEEAVEIYCERLETKADEYEDRSLEAFGACLKASTDFGWFSSWSRMCERELGQIRPEDYPTAAELRAAPEAVVSVRDIERPILRVE